MLAGPSDNDIILNSVSDGICINSDGQFHYINEPFARKLGYTVEELMIKHTYSTIAPEDLETVKEYSDKRLEGLDVPSRYEISLVKKDGSRLPVEISITMIDYKEKYSGLAVVRDLSYRIESENQLQVFMESATDGFVIIDKNMKYVKANNIWLKQAGITESDIIGKSMLDIFPNAQNSGRYRWRSFRGTASILQSNTEKCAAFKRVNR